MGKHKQSKRERKFTAKGGAKARLDKGEKLAPKGKVKRKRRTSTADQQNKETAAEAAKNRRLRQEKEHEQHQQNQRNADDFTGRENLGDMDVGSFLANLEEDLKEQPPSVLSSDSEDDDSGEGSGDDEEVAPISKNNKKDTSSKKKTTTTKKNKVEKNDDESASDSDSGDDDDDNSSSENESEEDTPASKKRKSKAAAAAAKDKTTKSSSKKIKGKKNRSNDSDSSDSSDEDDIDNVEAKMKAEMKKLQDDDPEFHEFLQENEQSLLEFGDDDDDDDDDDDEDDDDDLPGTASKKEKIGDDKNAEGSGRSIELTPKILKNMEHGAFTAHGLKSLKKIVRAYKSACQVASATDAMIEEGGSSSSSKKRKKEEKTYRIESSQVFDKLMVICLNRCHEAFHFHLLATDEDREMTITDNAKIQKEKQQPKVKSHKEKQQPKATKDDKKKDAGSKAKKEKSKGKADDTESSDEEMENDEEAESSEADEPTSNDEDLDEKPLDPKILERSPRWNDVKSVLNTFLKSTLHLVSESKEPDLLAVVLKALSKYVRYMTPFPRTAEAFLKILTGLWSAPIGDASADYQVVRLNAFLRIRQLALTQPFPFIELSLKKTYLAYARRAKFGGNASSVMTNALPTLTFMGNCLVELYSLDHQSSYQHAFVYIRQLALLLRTAMQKKTPEAFQQVYCWQYMHCLKLWVAVLSAACKQRTGDSSSNPSNNDDQMMRSLVYPLTEIILGTVRLAPAPARHIPLRFHCVRLLQQLAAASELYIPTTSILLEMLDLKELSMKPKKIKAKGGSETTRGVQLPFLLKLSKEDPLRTAEEHEACVAELFKLLNREADLYRYSAGFPEFSMQIIQRLKKFMKATKNSRWRAYARGCVDLCRRHTDFAVNARSNLTEAPRDVKRLECLRQPSDPSMTERYDAAVQKENAEWTSLIAASASESKKADNKSDDCDGDESSRDGEGQDEEVQKKNDNRKKRKKVSEAAAPEMDGTVMEIEDTVKEGIDWSSEEE